MAVQDYEMIMPQHNNDVNLFVKTALLLCSMHNITGWRQTKSGIRDTAAQALRNAFDNLTRVEAYVAKPVCTVKAC